eukprot:g6358.t1
MVTHPSKSERRYLFHTGRSKMSLKTLVFLGSVRSKSPWWGGLPPRTGDRVLKYVKNQIEEFNKDTKNQLDLTVVDPLDFPSVLNLATNNGNPTYYAAKDVATTGEDLAKLVKLVKDADCYIIVTPEYNHSLPPALTATMNQVGCSNYANKVSACVCYSGFSSAGGGTRCAVALRPYLSELGCLSVSKQVIISNANKFLSEEGNWEGEHKDGALKTMKSMLEQLAWWGQATKVARNSKDSGKCIMSRVIIRMGTLGHFVRKWDLYKKVPDDLYVSTYSGVCLSLLGMFLMVLLFSFELQSYLTPEIRTDVVLDEGEHDINNPLDLLSINFNLTLHDLPCQFASVDVSDITGTRKHDIHQDITKIRLDHKGRVLGPLESNHVIEAEEHEEVHETEEEEIQALIAEGADNTAHSDSLSRDTFKPYLEKHKDKLVMVNFFAPWCIWCRRFEPVWEATAKKLMGKHDRHLAVTLASVDCTKNQQLCEESFVRAYPTVYLYKRGNEKPMEAYHNQRTVSALIRRAHEVVSGEMHEADRKKHELSKQDVAAGEEKEWGHEGCNIAGQLHVKKVPGNFHMNLHSPRYTAHHELVNASHVVHQFSFGEPMTRSMRYRYNYLLAHGLSPEGDKLDGEEFTAVHKNFTFVHYLKVVKETLLDGATFEKHGVGAATAINTYPYSAYSNEHKEDYAVPSVIFQYDLSPMTVVKQTVHKPLYHFVTNFCAIIGGVFAVIGVADRFLSTLLSGFSKKIA